MKFVKLIIGIITISVLFCSCSSGVKPTSKDGTSGVQGTSESSQQTSSSTTTSPNSTAPTDSSFNQILAGQRPYAVMIDNQGTKVLPQGGIFLAQVIYEIVVEGGESRLMPLFWGVDPELIGPVRSSRHYFLDYVLENDAIYVHFGYSPQARNDIKTLKINNINGVANGGEIFWDITKDRGNWQDSYTSMSKIQQYVKKAKYRTTTDKEPVFSFNDSPIDPQGSNANVVDLRFSTASYCSFQYDNATKLYMRYREGKPHMERTNGKQLTAKNIIVQFEENFTINGDTKGRQEVKTVGSGNGYYISQGKYTKIKWSKASRRASTIYTLEDGSTLKLNPGQTWVEILPTSGKATFKE